MSDIEHNLLRQQNAARDLLINLRHDGAADDAELVADSIEGETNLHEAITAALDEIDECDVIEAGCRAKAAEFEARGSAAAKRRDRIRALIEQAMVATEQPSLRLPSATVSVARRPPGLIVANEAEIPARFWVAQPIPAPKLDKKALLAALNDNQAVPGVGLDNGTVSLTIRRK
jgi:hypothetical protein